MKKRNRFIPWLSALLIAALLLALPGAVLAERMIPDWTYDNSLLVTVRSEETKTFTPADFPGVECDRVFVLDKSVADSGFVYRLVLRIQQADAEQAVETVKELPFVLEVTRNDEYVQRESILRLNRSVVYLKVGQTVDLSIDELELHSTDHYVNFGVVFTVDPEAVGSDETAPLSFSEYGVTRFWPNDDGQDVSILNSKPRGTESQPSEIGAYCGLTAEGNADLLDVVAALAQSPDILTVSISREHTASGNPPHESWNINREDVATVSLSGGEIVNGFNENGPRINQIATIRGIAPGIAVLSVERSGFGAYAKDRCGVLVYQPGSLDNPGDLNRNGTTDAGDALRLLQHSVNLITLSEDEMTRGDLNVDNAFDVSDALIVLQIAVGLLD